MRGRREQRNFPQADRAWNPQHNKDHLGSPNRPVLHAENASIALTNMDQVWGHRH